MADDGGNQHGKNRSQIAFKAEAADPAGTPGEQDLLARAAKQQGSMTAPPRAAARTRAP